MAKYIEKCYIIAILFISICSVHAENETGNNLDSPVSENEVESSGNSTSLSEQSLQTLELQNRVATLESRLQALETILVGLHNDFQFYHVPTSELQYVDMEVVHWNEALKNNLRDVAVQFDAGSVTGALSRWEFSLANENDAVTVNLLLVAERYGKRALFAGFTAYVLNTDGNIYSQANALPVNFLDGNGRNLHLPNVVTLNEIRNSTNGLLSDDEDAFRLRFRLELIAAGHKLYSDGPGVTPTPTKDIQTVVFEVANLFTKLEERKQSWNGTWNSSDPYTVYTKFTLVHDAWGISTNWSAEIVESGEGEAISFKVILEQCPWPRLYASFHLEVRDSQDKLLHRQTTPVNDFVKDRINIDPLFSISQLKEEYGDELPNMLQFKLQLVVYGLHARYYSDVI